MLYRTAGQFKTSYAADHALFPVRQDAILLGFIGITDVTFVRAEKLALGPEARKQAIEAARREIESEFLRAA